MNVLRTGLLLALVACAPLPPRAVAQDPPMVAVEQAWIRTAAQGQFETWAFATITNRGKSDALLAVDSPAAGSVVLRATTMTDAGPKMRSVLSIPIPAHGTLAMSAEGYYIAFIEPKHKFASGDTIAATLKFASGARITVGFRVSEADGNPGG